MALLGRPPAPSSERRIATVAVDRRLATVALGCFFTGAETGGGGGGGVAGFLTTGGLGGWEKL